MTDRERLLVAYRAATDLLGRAAMLVVLVLAARRLPASGVGVLVLGTTLGWLTAVASDAGMQMHLARRVALERWRAGALLTQWLAWRCATAAAALTLTGAALAGLSLPAGHAPALFLLVLAAAGHGLLEFLYHFFRGLGRSDLESACTLGQRVASLAGAAIALQWRADVTTLAAALAMGTAVPLLWALAAARQLAAETITHSARKDGARAGSLSAGFRETRREFTHHVAPIGIGVLLSALYFRVDTFLLEHWHGLTVVGLYGAVFRLVDALRLFPAAVVAVALPALCRTTDLALLRGLATRVAAASAAAGLVLWTLAPWLVPALYGAAYEPAVLPFRILLLAFPLMSLNLVLTQQLIGWGGHQAFAGACAAALMTNVILNSRLIPAFSAAGAAWAALATETVLTLVCVRALAVQHRRAAARSPLAAIAQEP